MTEHEQELWIAGIRDGLMELEDPELMDSPIYTDGLVVGANKLAEWIYDI